MVELGSVRRGWDSGPSSRPREGTQLCQVKDSPWGTLVTILPSFGERNGQEMTMTNEDSFKIILGEALLLPPLPKRLKTLKNSIVEFLLSQFIFSISSLCNCTSLRKPQNSSLPDQPPYSSDLALDEFWLFPEKRFILKTERFMLLKLLKKCDLNS